MVSLCEKEKTPKLSYRLLFFTLVSIWGFFVFSGAKSASAASLYLSPNQGNYEVGQTFSVGVYVSSPDQALNAFAGTLIFPKDILQVTTLNKSGSIASFWVKEPSFSNANGSISFEGLALNPGFKGAAGKIITVTFKTKALGDASLGFSASEILANDGKGTNILAGLGKANLSVITAATGTPATAPGSASDASGAPLAPQIFSATHPDPEAWYNNNNPKFSWYLPPGTDAVRVLSDQYPTSKPSKMYKPAISQKELVAINDGTWYFHVQLHNAQGWGAISHFRFQIDTVPPAPFAIKFPHGRSGQDPRPVALFNTTDFLSGIAYYEIKIGNGQAFKILPGEIVDSNPYSLPVQSPGEHSIIVKAFDKAGNNAGAAESFSVASLEAPELTSYPSEMMVGDIFKVTGKTYPNASVTIFLKDDSGLTTSDQSVSNLIGNFTMIWVQKLQPGTYTFWAQTFDQDGAKSAATAPINFVVRQAVSTQLANFLLDYLSVFTLFTLFIIGLAFLAWYGWHKFLILRDSIRQGVKGVEKTILQVFDRLQRDMEQQISLLEKVKTKRQLTEEEKKIVRALKKDLLEAQKGLGQGVKDIKKQVK